MLSEDDLHGIRKLYPLRGPIFARHSGRCLDIAEISTSNGADAHQWEYWGGWNQIFTVQWMEGSHYRLVAQHSNKVNRRRCDLAQLWSLIPPVGLVERR